MLVIFQVATLYHLTIFLVQVTSSVPHQQNASVKNILSSPALKQNQRRENSGKIIRGILLNKDARQSQAFGLHSEQKISNLEKDKRPPRPSHVQLVMKDINGVSDDKVVVNDLHSEKQERRTRNKDRPDRGVWTLRRSDGSYASDESLSSSASQLSLSAVDSLEGRATISVNLLGLVSTLILLVDHTTSASWLLLHCQNTYARRCAYTVSGVCI